MATSHLLRRMSTRIALAGALVLSTIVLSHCRMVNDTITGVDVTLAAKNGKTKEKCMKKCHKDREAAEKSENRRFKNAVRACHSDKSCRKAEERRHKDVQQTLKDQERRCRSECYNEGAIGIGR